MKPKLSIIIVNYLSEDALEHCLRSVHVATDVQVEIILVDNSAGHGADRILKDSGLKGFYFPMPENIGYTKAANLGARHAEGEYLCFLQPDTIFDPRALDRLMNWVEQHRRSVAGPREKYADDSIATSAFPLVSRRYILGANLLYKLGWPPAFQPWLAWMIPPFTFAQKCRTAKAPFKAPALSGSCLVMARSTWHEVGEWNEVLSHFGLESEWFERAMALGVSAWYMPEAVMYHDQGLSIRRSGGVQVRHEANQNRKWFARRKGLIILGILLVILLLERLRRRD